MAVLVSHAMRRFPSSPPDTSYSSYSIRGEGSRSEGESALLRSMRYADPWMYGSVRAPGGLLLAPAFALCVCPDYVNGTKRSSKKSPSTCKKCKGTRLPLPSVDSKFGTVRCYPTSSIHNGAATPLRAGTVRVTSSSSSRPSILPTSTADPYDLMRRSRLSSESASQFRTRSTSPNKVRNGESRSRSGSRSKGTKPESYNSTFGRRSILECDVNPYELITSNETTKPKESNITFVNGQRIRVRPTQADQEYEDVQVRRPTATVQTKSAPQTTKLTPSSSSASPQATPPSTNEKHRDIISIQNKSPKIKTKNYATSPKVNEDNYEFSNRFKSILKKPSPSFSDTDSSGGTVSERSPSPPMKSGSHFYIPTPPGVIRKKVQFLVDKDLVENEVVCNEANVQEGKSKISEDDNDSDDVFEDALQEQPKEVKQQEEKEEYENEKDKKKTRALHRSFSDRKTQEEKKVIFYDTMALRQRKDKSEPKINFADLEKLDGITLRTRKLSSGNLRPTRAPPPPPLHITHDIVTEKLTETLIKDNLPAPVVALPENNEPLPKEDVTINKSEAENSAKTSDCMVEIRSKHVTQVLDNNVISSTKPDEKLSLEKLDKCINDSSNNGIAPSAPPRKRSNNKQPQINIINSSTGHTVRIESPTSENCNKTIVRISSPPDVHKLKIKNEFSDTTNVQTLSVSENPQRKTSILINGDDCYSTVNVNDNIPLYQSSVVVKDSVTEISPVKYIKQSSTIYITGTFISNQSDSDLRSLDVTTNGYNTTEEDTNNNNNKEVVTKDYAGMSCSSKIEKENNEVNSTLIDTFNESDIPSSDMLREFLRDPVEAVRRNLVPHVCGKSEVNRRPRDKKFFSTRIPSLTRHSNRDSSLEDKRRVRSHEESPSRLRNYESICDDVSSEHSSSTQYEMMDTASECYTDHSNRSSVTEEEMANRSKFYELLAESGMVEVLECDDHHYESIKVNNDPIYEEIEIPPPLPANPPPTSLLNDLKLDKEFTTRSIFEGASKYDILYYLVDAKERGIVQEDSYTYNFGNHVNASEEDTKVYSRALQLSSVSDSSEDNSLVISGALIDDKATVQKAAEIERNDSGVGSETSKSSLSKYRTKQEISILCEDCEAILETKVENEPLLCRKCVKKRSERKEIITEIVETEEKYSKDLQIILEEFYQPMLVAGLLTPEQLSAIFLNVEELLENSRALAERLRDAVEIALEQGDDDLLTVNMGKLFLEATPMLHAFETYCVRQGSASLLLASLEKEKELLRIFLRVSQMENTMLRRMNLNSFLMVPVQRVTKYPLLLARLYKVTPIHHGNKEELKEAQHKIELHLNHMNSQTKDVPSKLWRRIGNSAGRRSSAEMDLVNIKLRKIAVDVLEWNHEEANFVLEGRLLFTQPSDNNWRKGRTIKLTPVNALLVTNGKTSSSKPVDRTEEHSPLFARHSARDAALLLVRDKNGRYSLLREPLYLERCVIASDPAWHSFFEVQELLGKDTFIFKAEDEERTNIWYKQLQYHAQGMGAWRKRRNALANIMINGLGLRS